MDDEAKVEAYLRLYERQMTHYEKTQDVEWKSSFGVWALLAAAIYWAAHNAAAADHSHVTVDPRLCILIYVFPVIHGLWLWRVHRSEEFDKVLWSRYRGAALHFLSLEEKLYKGRGRLEHWGWITLEAGITLILVIVLGTFLW